MNSLSPTVTAGVGWRDLQVGIMRIGAEAVDVIPDTMEAEIVSRVVDDHQCVHSDRRCRHRSMLGSVKIKISKLLILMRWWTHIKDPGVSAGSDATSKWLQ